MSVSLSLRPVHRTTRQNEQDKSKQKSLELILQLLETQ